MVHAVAQSQHREQDQGGNLDHVDGDAHRRRAIYTSIGDVGHNEGEEDGDQHHEGDARIGGVHEVRPERAYEVAAQDPHDPDHHARVDPVIKMGSPTHDEFREPRVAPRLIVGWASHLYYWIYPGVMVGVMG